MITLPIVVFLLLIVFSGLVGAALPLLIGGVTILGAFAVLRVLSGLTDVSVFAIQVVTMLGLGLAIDYSLFVVTRFREELKFDENDVRGALQRTMATAGRTILFSGLTVSTSLLSLLLFPEFFLRSMGMGSIAATLVALLASLTILPAVLALLGKRANALSIQRLFRRTSMGIIGTHESRGAWYRLSQAVMRWPVPVALVVIAILALLGTPFLHATFSTPGVSVLAQDQKERFDATGDNRAAIASGMQRTGWLITSAAVLLAVVMAAFGSSRTIFVQEIGIGLAIAVIMDATLVRMLLVPATMRLLGQWNWWAPAPLRALWQRVGLSENAGRAATPSEVVEGVLEEIEKKEVHV